MDGEDRVDSPRVLEIVEKNESVSWKLEYNDLDGSDMGSLGPGLPTTSPSLKRKQVNPLTTSPLSVKRAAKSGKKRPFAAFLPSPHAL